MSLISTCCKSPIRYQQRNLFEWLNIIFNRVDESRRKEVGPDRICAEWLLKNGATVKFVGQKDYLTNYNNLPSENLRFSIEEIDATESSIMHYGFDHFKGCQHIKKIIFHKCSYLENEALKGLSPLQSTLNYLQISSCFNITEEGLSYLKILTNLNRLNLSNLPYVKNKAKIVGELQQYLPKCNINFE